MMSSILDEEHPLSGADPESYFSLHVVAPGYKPKGEGDCGYLAQHNQAYSERVGLANLGRLRTKERTYRKERLISLGWQLT